MDNNNQVTTTNNNFRYKEMIKFIKHFQQFNSLLDQYEFIIEEGDRNNNDDKGPPAYECPQCGGYMRKNEHFCTCIATIPPSYQYRYRCDKCGFTEELDV